MPRNLEQLKKQYNSSNKGPEKRPGGPGGPRGGPGAMRGATGKPKNAKKTLSRLAAYSKGYRGRIAAVLLCMAVSTVTSLIGGYMLAPSLKKK